MSKIIVTASGRRVEYLTDRSEIALALNFGDYPVLMIDHDKPVYEGSTFCQGSKVCVKYTPNSVYLRLGYDKPLRTRGEIYYSDGRLGISSNGALLKADFGYQDVIDSVEWAQAVTVEPGQTVVVVEQWSSRRECTVRKMKVPERIDPHCQTVCLLMEIEA